MVTRQVGRAEHRFAPRQSLFQTREAAPPIAETVYASA